jgi:hypothetical protein
VIQTFQILYVTEFWTTDPVWGIIHPKKTLTNFFSMIQSCERFWTTDLKHNRNVFRYSTLKKKDAIRNLDRFSKKIRTPHRVPSTSFFIQLFRPNEGKKLKL